MTNRSHRHGHRGTYSVVGIGWIAGAVLLLCSIPLLAGIVEFSDPGLEAAVREAIGKASGDILDSDVLGVTVLDARYRNIASLEGIEQLVNLTDLDLYGNDIVDIAPLSGLTGLRSLNLTRNEIDDIAPLSPLVNLRDLQLRNNQIRDLGPLVNNPAFAGDATIALSFNPLPLQPGTPEMRDIEALQGRGTHVRFAPIIDFLDPGVEAAIREEIGKETEDILAPDLASISVLSARYRGISSLEGLELCVNLTELDLYGNDIVDINALSDLTKLTKLSLEDNEIRDLSPLANLVNLKTLYLDNNQIDDLSPLADLINLTTLYLWENEIVDLSPLANLSNLTGLYLYFNWINDITPLSNLIQLTGLGLSWNQIIDIGPLSKLPSLTRLYLDHNEIMVIAPLVTNAGIDQDDIVHLQGNPFPIEPGSPNMHDINLLKNRGVLIEYSPESD